VLERLAKTGTKLDAIAASHAAGAWLALAEAPRKFPALGNPPLVTPPSYYWPTFLTASNLVNVANRIAVIAIVAVGMTLVIVTGGIDLSVGSLIALSAVMCTWLIQRYGALEATTLVMIASSLLAILLCAALGACNGALVTFCDLPPFIVTLAMMLV